jgi:hypothetical protein
MMDHATIKAHCKRAIAGNSIALWKRPLKDAMVEGRPIVNMDRTLLQYAADAVIAACYPYGYRVAPDLDDRRVFFLPQTNNLIASLKRTPQ